VTASPSAASPSRKRHPTLQPPKPSSSAGVAFECYDPTYDADRDGIRWAVDGWLPIGCVTSLYAKGDIGKSRIALQLACAAVMNRDWLGLGVWASTAAYLTAEDHPGTVRYRINSFEDEGLAEPGKYPTILRAPDGAAIIWADGEPTKLGDSLAAIAAAHDILIIDSLSVVYAGNESDYAEASAFLRWLGCLAHDNDCAILLPGDSADYSASTAWRNVVRCLWWFHKDGDSHVLEVKKLSLSQKPDPLRVESRPGNVGWKSAGTGSCR